MKKFLIFAAAPALVSAAPSQPAGNPLTLQLSGVRNGKGVIHICLTASATRFLKCKDGEAAAALTIPSANSGKAINLGSIPAGTYALLVVHDENSNGRLDMTLGIPREGFGFSNNPAMRPRAPRWDEIRFAMPGAPMRQSVRIRYVL